VEFNTFVLILQVKNEGNYKVGAKPKSCSSSQKNQLRKVNFKHATK